METSDNDLFQFNKIEEEFPSEFNLLVIGTGFVESVIAAAASRVGKTVLHIDPNNFYGSSWASFNLDKFDKLITTCCNTFPLSSASITETTNDNKILQINENHCHVKNSKHTWHITTTDDDSINSTDENQTNDKLWTKEKLMKLSNKFNIDLIPKIQYSCGELVNLLISSNICRYAEFRCVDKICTIFEQNMQNVPCSRTDVFNSKDLTIVEKRLLMKLLEQCMSYKEHPDNFKDFEEQTFLQFLKSNRLTEKIIHCVLYAISMSHINTNFKDGMTRMQLFLQSLGRYGNTSFIYPMYGCGEIPQCFCRLCAVFGGIYCLKRPLEIVKFGQNDEASVIRCDKQDIKVDHIVIGPSCITEEIIQELQKTTGPIDKLSKSQCGRISRAIFICTSPIGESQITAGGGGVSILRIPSDNFKDALVIQLSHYSSTCPNDLYLIHMITECISDDPESDLKPYVNQIISFDDPTNVIYSAYYQIDQCKGCASGYNLASDKVHLACGPFYEIDFDLSLENAKLIFQKIYPNEEYLPRAPDPYEILIGDEDPTSLRNDGTAGELNEIIRELEQVVLNQDKCIEENTKNENKDQSPD